MLAFHREDSKLGDEELVFVESVLEVNRPASVHKEAEDEIKTIKERRKKIDYSDAHFYMWLRLGGGAKYALRNSDIVRNAQNQKQSKYDALAPRNQRHYEYKLNSIINDGQRSLYVIDILPKKNSKKALIQARYYIDVPSLAITKWEITLTQAGLDREN
jgi:hypothetical protein